MGAGWCSPLPQKKTVIDRCDLLVDPGEAIVPPSVWDIRKYLRSDFSDVILFTVSINVIKHYDQKHVAEERVYLVNTLIL